MMHMHGASVGSFQAAHLQGLPGIIGFMLLDGSIQLRQLLPHMHHRALVVGAAYHAVPASVPPVQSEELVEDMAGSLLYCHCIASWGCTCLVTASHGTRQSVHFDHEALAEPQHTPQSKQHGAHMYITFVPRWPQKCRASHETTTASIRGTTATVRLAQTCPGGRLGPEKHLEAVPRGPGAQEALVKGVGMHQVVGQGGVHPYGHHQLARCQLVPGPHPVWGCI